MTTQALLKPGAYVIDASASGRYDTAVYRVIKHLTSTTVVELVGYVRNGRLSDYAPSGNVTHRTTANLRVWQ